MANTTETAEAAAEREKKNTGMTNILVIIMSLVFILMSALMIFVSGIQVVYLCYAICTAAIIVGIYLIVRYFMTDAYRNVNAYGFSAGTLLVILGVCGMIRAAKMAGAFVVILGIILLLSGVIVLQHSLDLRRMEDVVWIFVIVVAIVILICSIMVIIQPFPSMIKYDIVVWWMMMIAGALGVIINIYTMIRVSLFKRKEKKLETAKAADVTTEPAPSQTPDETEPVSDPAPVSTDTADETKPDESNEEDKTDGNL